MIFYIQVFGVLVRVIRIHFSLATDFLKIKVITSIDFKLIYKFDLFDLDILPLINCLSYIKLYLQTQN